MTTRDNSRDTPDPEDLLSVTAAAALLKVSRRTMYRYLEQGHLPRQYLPGNRLRLSRADVLGLLGEKRAS